MFTVFASPTHVMPVESRMPVIKDEIGGGAAQYRRRQTRSLKRWELNVPGIQEQIEPVLGVLEYIQGDTPVWFDGAGAGEIVTPIPMGFGDGVTTDFIFPHKHVFVSSAVIYQNGQAQNNWEPIGDYVVAHSVRFNTAPAANVQLTVKYRRKMKVVLDTESAVVSERGFRSQDPSKSVQRMKYYLQEVAI